MNGGRVKNIIIIMLLLVNAFMLSLLMMDRAEARRVARETEQELRQVLALSGTALAEDFQLPSGTLTSAALRRDMDAERAMVEYFIGPSDVSEQGGNIFEYTSSGGSALCRGTGETQILVKPGAVPLGDPERTTRRALRRMGLEAGTLAVDSSVPGQTTVTVRCAAGGRDVLNSSIDFLYSDECLVFINGSRLFGERAAGGGEEGMDACTALLRFLALRREGGGEPGDIGSITPGYISSVVISGESTLTPVWLIESGGEAFCINALTGALETI